MKKFRFLLSLLVILVSINLAQAQQFFGLDKSPMDVSSFPASHQEFDKIVKVIYSRPQLKGRKLATLAPNGKVWRTGANEATEIIFYKDVLFGGQPVKAGHYSLFTIPSDNAWTIIISKAKNVWGSYYYKTSEDVVRVKASRSTIKNPIEVFSIGFDGKPNDFKLYLGWENSIISVPILIKQ